MSLFLVGRLLMAMAVACSGTEGDSSAQPATAATNSADEMEATGLVKMAALQYDQGLLDEALGTLKRAQALSPRPAILYNIGQVQRARRDCAAALAAYSSFVSQTPPADPNRERALRWQAEMRTCVEGVASTTRTGAGSPSIVAAAPPLLPTPVVPASLLTEQPARGDEEIVKRPMPVTPVAGGTGRAARVTAWSLIGAGVLIEVGALLLEWKAKSIESELDGGLHNPRDYMNLRLEGEQDSRWALWAGVGGGVFAASGSAVLILNRQPGVTSTTTAFLGWKGAF